jgi:hypothetical protein
MTVAARMSDTVSRRAVLTGGLATSFLLAFHLPMRAANEQRSRPTRQTRNSHPTRSSASTVPAILHW